MFSDDCDKILSTDNDGCLRSSERPPLNNCFTVNVEFSSSWKFAAVFTRDNDPTLFDNMKCYKLVGDYENNSLNLVCAYMTSKKLCSCFPIFETLEVVVLIGNFDILLLEDMFGLAFEKVDRNVTRPQSCDLNYILSNCLVSGLLDINSCFSLSTEEQQEGVVAEYSVHVSGIMSNYLRAIVIKNIVITSGNIF